MGLFSSHLLVWTQGIGAGRPARGVADILRAAVWRADDTAFHPTGTHQTLSCALSAAADHPRCSCGIPLSCLPNDMSPDPAKSRPSLECMPHLPSARPCAPSRPAIKRPSNGTVSGNGALRPCGMYGAKARCMHYILHVAQRRLRQGSVCFMKSGEAAGRAVNN